MMIQLQASPFVRNEAGGRMLPSLSHSQLDRHTLEGLADLAGCLHEPGVYSPASSPSSPNFREYNFGMCNLTNQAFRPMCGRVPVLTLSFRALHPSFK